MIYIESKRKSIKTLEKKYPSARIIDVTSNAEFPWVKFSPFYPHGNLEIPFSENFIGESVEGIWQGLKVFSTQDIDISKFSIKSMKGLKRTVRSFGKPLGHRAGINGTELLDYITARKKIFLKLYAQVLQDKVYDLVIKLKDEAEYQDLVLLDFETNEDIENPKKPLSHAALIKLFLQKKFPEVAFKVFKEPEKENQLDKKSKKSKTVGKGGQLSIF